MKSKLQGALFGAALCAVSMAGVALADDPGHPGINEVDGRLAHQQERLDQAVAQHRISEYQAEQDEHMDARIAHQEQADIAANGGHLTADEFHGLNHELNENSARIGGRRR